MKNTQMMNKNWMRLVMLFVLCLVWVLVMPQPTQAQQQGGTINVAANSTSELNAAFDIANGNGQCAATPTIISLGGGTYNYSAQRFTEGTLKYVFKVFCPITIEGNGSIIRSSNTSARFQLFRASGPSVTAYNGELNLNNVILRDAYSDTSFGSAIYSSGADIFISDSTITNNKGSNGTLGAIYISNASLIITNSTLSSNQAISSNGGAINASSASVEILNSTLTGNISTGNGGAVYASNSIIEIMNTDLIDNAGISGGGVYSSGGNVIIQNSTIEENEAYNFSGAAALLLQSTNTVAITNTVIQNNGLTSSGSLAVQITGVNSASITNTAFIGNETALGIASSTVTIGSDASFTGTYHFSGNTSSAIRVNSSNLSLNNLMIYNNTSYNGGAIEDTTATSNSYTISISGTSFENNQASSYGGAIYSSRHSRTTFDIVDSVFHNNTAQAYGGAMALSGNSSNININNTIFSDNSSNSRGGAIYSDVFSSNPGKNISIVNSTFDGNTAQDWGGAILVSASENVTISNSHFENNLSNTHGGAIYIYSTFNITGSTFINNNAVHRGGAIHAQVPINVTAPTLNQNCIVGNSHSSISTLVSTTYHILNAENNWWGSNGGPIGGTGTGTDGFGQDSIEGQVDTDPYLTTAPSGCPNGEPDADNDGLSDNEEATLGTDPNDSDTDNDELSDFQEVVFTLTDPLDDDSDNDNLLDGDEVSGDENPFGGLPTNPNDNDHDNDGLLDGDEVYTHGSNPRTQHTDSDGLSDYDEVITHGTNPALSDTDGDTLSDPYELFEYPTSPVLADTDDDGFRDDVDNCPIEASNWNGDYDDDGLGDTCEAGPVDRDNTSVNVTPTEVSAGGGDQFIEVEVIVRDQYDNVMDNIPVVISTDAQYVDISNPSGTSDVNGVFSTEVRRLSAGLIVLDIVVGDAAYDLLAGFEAVGSETYNRQLSFIGPDVTVVASGLNNIIAGQTLIYSFTVDNISGGTATNVDVFSGLRPINGLSAGTITSVVTPEGAELVQQGLNGISWIIPEVDADDTYTFFVYARSAANLTINHDVYFDVLVDAANDYDSSDNEDSFKTDIVIASAPTSQPQSEKLAVAYDVLNSSGTTTVSVGDTVTLEVQVTNATDQGLNPETLYNIEGFAALKDTFANSFTAASILQFVWPDPTRPGVLAPGETATATFDYTVTETYASLSSTIRNVRVSADDSNPADGAYVALFNELTYEELDVAGANLNVQLNASRGSANIGDEITFTVLIHNRLGSVEAAEITSVASQLTNNVNMLTAPVTIEPNETQSVTFTYTVQASDVPSLTAFVTINGVTTSNSIALEESVQRTITILPPPAPPGAPDLVVQTVINTPTVAFRNTNLTIPMQVFNNGGTNAADTLVRLALPPNVDYIGDAPGTLQPSYDAATHTLTWDLQIVEVNTGDDIVPILSTDAGLGDIITLTFNALSSVEDADYLSNTLTLNLPIVQPAPTTVTLDLGAGEQAYSLVADGQDILDLVATVTDQLGQPYAGAVGLVASNSGFLTPLNAMVITDSNGQAALQLQTIQPGLDVVYVDFGNGVSASAFVQMRPNSLTANHTAITIGVGGTGIVDLSLLNTAASADAFTLSVDPTSINSLWDASFAPDTLALSSGQVGQSRLSISIPLASPPTIECAALTGNAIPVTINASRTSDSAIVDSIEVLVTVVPQPPALTSVFPMENANIGNDEVLFGWRSNTPGTANLYYRPVGGAYSAAIPMVQNPSDPTYYSARVTITNTEDYEWYGTFDNGCGVTNTNPNPRTFSRVNAVSFLDAAYAFTIVDDYDVSVDTNDIPLAVQVRNDDIVTWDVQVSLDNPYEDLIVGFIGAGSIDTYLSLIGTSTANLNLRVFTQETQQSTYTITAHLEAANPNTGVVITDDVPITITIQPDTLDLALIDPELDARTMVVTAELVNNGATLTDLDVQVVDATTGIPANFVILPDIAHAYLPTGQSLHIQIIPLDVIDATQAPSENYVVRATSRNGIADLSFFDTQGTPVSFDLTQVCAPEKPRARTCVSTPGSISYESAGWYCTNRPDIDMTIPWTLNGVDVEAISSINVTMDFAPGGVGVPYSHSTEMFFNNVSIGGGIVPDISQLNLDAPVEAVVTDATYQTLNLRSLHTNSAHYTVASNAVVTVQYGRYERTACYSDEELGDASTFPCGENGACELDITASQLRLERNDADPSLLDLTVRVGNAGTIATLLNGQYQNIDVVFYNGNPQTGGLPIASVTVSQALNPGEYQDVTATVLIASTVASPLYVVVDDSNLYTETDEANNIYISNRYLSPDLTVTAVDASQMVVDANSLTASGVVTAHIETPVQVTQPFTITFFDDLNHNGQYDAGTDTVLQTVTKNSLTGSTAVSTTVSGRLQFINSPVYVMLDSGDSIIETDELNNLGMSVSCLASTGCAAALPDISASHLVRTPNGSDVTLTVRIGNGGGADVNNQIAVTFYDGDPLNGGTPLVNGTVLTTGGLAVGEYEDVSLNVALANLNIRPVWVVADDNGTQTPNPINGAIAESNELNNIYRSNVYVVDPVAYPNTEPVVNAGLDQQTRVGSLFLNADVTDDGLPNDTLLPVWTVFSGNADAVRFAPIEGIDTTVTFSEPGTYELQLTVSDLELEDWDTVIIEVLPPAPVPQPITTPPGCLVSPSQNDIVQQPVDIVVNQALTNASVFYWPITHVDNYVTLVEGASLSANTTAAVFDTTVLANDIYVIQVVGTKADQTQIVCNLSVSVQGEYKPGRVVLSTVDFTVPVSGLPITIGRTYDSLERHYQSDFGYGWSLLIGSPRLEIDSSDNVTLTMPDGTRKTFYFAPQPYPLFSSFAAPQYLSEPGEYGKFRASSCNLIVRSGGQFFCFEGGRYSANASAFTYEDPYGRIFTFSNAGELTSITDLNDNTLTFSATGITSSDGLSVYFNRDTEGRIIEACLDENGDSSCAGDVVYTYEYDETTGDLRRVILPEYPNDPIQYEYYTEPGLEHFFKNGTDPNGNSAVQTVYEDGRLAFVCDALVDTSITPCGAGKFTTAYTYDVENRSTTQTNFDGGVLITTYDDYGNLLSESGTAVAGTTTYDYDANNNLTHVENGEDELTIYNYDTQGNRISVNQHFDYDNDDVIDDGELIPVIRAVYNDYGAPTQLTDANGVEREITYTPAGMPDTASDPLGEFGQYEWNTKGNPTAVMDANGARTEYLYDPYGNVTQVTEPLRPVYGQAPTSNVMTFTYDNMGRRLTSEDVNGTLTTTTYDDLGRVTNVKTVDDENTTLSETAYLYDANGNRTHLIEAPNDPVLKRTTRYTYDSANRVTMVEYLDETDTLLSEETTVTTYDFRGNVETQTDAAGVKTCYDYNLAGQLEFVTQGCNTPTNMDDVITQYVYDAAGRRTQTIQVDVTVGGTNAVTTTEYDDAGRVASVTNAEGGITRYEYDAAGQLTATIVVDNTDPQNIIEHTTRYVYDIRGRRTQTIYPDGATMMTVYDNAGRVIRSVDAAQTETSYTYDPVGNLLTMTRGLNTSAAITTAYDYDILGRRVRSQQGVGTGTIATTTYEYDALGRNTQTTDPLNYSTTAVYNLLGQITSQTDARNQTTSYTYDDMGRLTVTTYPDGTHSTTDYVNGRMASVINYQNQSGSPAAVSTVYNYDPVGRIESVTSGFGSANPSTMTYEYNAPFGRQSALIDARNTRTEYVYDLLGRMTQVTSAAGTSAEIVTEYVYDALGRRTLQTVAPGEAEQLQTAYTYDSRGRMLESIQVVDNTFLTTPNVPNDPTINPTTSYAYDSVGRRTSMTDALGQRTEYEYDALGRLLLVRNPMSETVQYDYDVLGRMTTITDGNGNDTTFLYNLRGEVTEKRWADYEPNVAGYETYTYDGNGNLLNQAFADGTVYTFDYDEMNRLTHEVYGSDYEYSYTYTDRGEVWKVWEGLEDTGTLLTTYGYDSLSRPTNVDHNGTPNDLSYTYDAVGNRTSMSIEGTAYSYEYDALNRVDTVIETIDPNGTPIAQTTTFNYDAVGRLSTINRHNGVNTTYTYDARNFLTNIQHENTLTPAILADYTYGYDLAGNRTSMTDVSGGVTTNITWDYDAANRLIEEHNDRNDIGYTTEYQYDQNGNRTRQIRANGDIIRYSYNENDQLTSIQYPNYITENYEYDARGNLISTEQQQGIGQPVQTASYTYDARNKLTEATVLGSGTVNFEYDYAGRRTQKSIYAGDTTNYLWDEFSRFGDVVQESTGANITSYTLAGGMVISQTQGSTTHYLLGDALNSTRALTDSSGTVQGTFAYNAFGNLIEQTGTANTNYLYTGQQFDDVTGLYSLRARYYDPNVGRFLSRDTWAYDLGNPIELNRYVYVANNPVNWVDPSGQFALGSYAQQLQEKFGTWTMIRKGFLEPAISGFVSALMGYVAGTLVSGVIIRIYDVVFGSGDKDIGDIYTAIISDGRWQINFAITTMIGAFLGVYQKVKQFELSEYINKFRGLFARVGPERLAKVSDIINKSIVNWRGQIFDTVYRILGASNAAKAIVQLARGDTNDIGWRLAETVTDVIIGSLAALLGAALALPTNSHNILEELASAQKFFDSFKGGGLHFVKEAIVAGYFEALAESTQVIFDDVGVPIYQ